MNVRRLLGAPVSLALLGLALFLLDWEGLQRALAEVDPTWFVAAMLVAFSQYWITGLRWHRLVKDIAPLPFVEHLAKYFYGSFLNTFTPANLGGDAYRLVALRPHASGVGSLIIALLRERLLGLVAYFLVYLACIAGLGILQPSKLSQGAGVFALAGALALGATVAFFSLPLLFDRIATWLRRRSRPRLSDLVSRLGGAARFESPQEGIALLGLSLLSLGTWVLAVRVVALDLELPISWPALGAVVVLAELVRLVPVSVQGIGIREGAYAYLVGLLGHSPEAGFVLGAVSYLALSFSLLACGIVGYGMPVIARSFPLRR